MKYLSYLLLVCIFFAAINLVKGQSGQKPMDSNSIIQQLYEQVKRTPLDSSINKTDSLVNIAKVKCGTSDNPIYCVAGLDFVQGYFYQNAYEGSEGNSTFLSKAIEAYRNVLFQYPDNEAALSNLIVLAIETENYGQIVKLMNELIEKFPNYRNGYNIGKGAIYENKGQILLATQAYKNALSVNQSSARAIGALTNIYLTKSNHIELSDDDIIELAQKSYDAGLSNYSANIYRHLYLQSYSIDHLIKWAFIMTENNWLDSTELNILKEDQLSRESSKNIEWMDELLFLLQAENIDELKTENKVDLKLDHWKYDIYDLKPIGRSQRITAGSVLFRILYNKGKDGLNNINEPNYEKAEQFWRLALELSYEKESSFFTKVAADLAKSYEDQGVNIDDSKFEYLIKQIFEGKGESYARKDYEMIRQYHITLGTIYHRNKKWEGGSFTNAEFQLSRALDKDFGPITNPDLRSMLGDVYRNTKKHRLAIRNYLKSIEEYLLLDRIYEAKDSLLGYKSYFDSLDLSENQAKKANALEKMIMWRIDFVSPDNQFLSGESDIAEYLPKIQISQDEISQNLDSVFVRLQFFKGISDLANQMPPENEYNIQLCNSLALKKLTGVIELHSPQDIIRLKNIQKSLEKSLVQSQEHEEIQYRTLNSQNLSSYKSYLMPNLEKKVLVPDNLFQLNGILIDYFGRNDNNFLAKIKQENNQFIEIKS